MSELLVADSFRVRVSPAGVAEARGFQQHLDRFRWSAYQAWVGPHKTGPAERRRQQNARARILAAEPSQRGDSGTIIMFEPEWTVAERHAFDQIDAFLEASRASIADFGTGWPRLELWRDAPGLTPRLALQLRELPPLADTIELRSAGYLKLQHPKVKGPNLAQFADVNRELGCEAILLDRRGNVVEGATTSLVWWPRDPDGPEPCGSIAESEDRVASVTEALLVQAGGRRLVGTKPHRRRIGEPQPRRATVAQLVKREVWAVNALHGIRPVTSIDGIALPEPDARRLRWFRDALDRSWEPLLSGAS